MTQHKVALQPSHIELEDCRVWFRTGNDVIPTLAFVIWDSGDRVAISVANEHNDGLGVLITLDDAHLMRNALNEILDRAWRQEVPD